MTDDGRFEDILEPEMLATSLSALSNIDPRPEDAALKDPLRRLQSDPFRKVPSGIEKRVNMLNALALLLVTQDQRKQAAAVGMRLDRESITIYWTKNNLATPTVAEQMYVNRLAGCFRDLQPYYEILQLVIEACKPKILRRIEKVVQACKAQSPPDLSDVFADVDNSMQAYQILEKLFRSRGLIPQSASNFKEAVGLFHAKLDAVSLNRFDDEVIAWVIAFAESLSQEKESVEKAMNVSKEQFQRLRKLGEFRMVCWSTRAACAKLPASIRRTLSAEYVGVPLGFANLHCALLNLICQVASPCPQEFQVPRSTVDALNTWTQHRTGNIPVSSFGRILMHYPNANPGPEGKESSWTILAGQHCELTIALYLVELRGCNGRAKFIEIGCSKAPCQWCHMYLECFNKLLGSKPKIVLSTTNGKREARWLMPAGDGKVKHAFLQRIGIEMETIFGNLGLDRSDIFNWPVNDPEKIKPNIFGPMF